MTKLLILLFVLSGVSKASEEIQHLRSWSTGIGVKIINNHGESIGYLDISVTRHFKNGFLFGAELGYTPVVNTRSDIDGNDYLKTYTGLIVGYKNKITQKFGYSVEILSGGGYGESTEVDGDLKGICICGYTVLRPSVSMYMSWSKYSDWSINIGRVFQNSQGFTIGGLTYRYKW